MDPELHPIAESAEDLLESIELGLHKAAAIGLDPKERDEAIRSQMASLRRWGEASPQQAITFANALGDVSPAEGVIGHEAGIACLALGQAMLGAAQAWGEPRLFRAKFLKSPNVDDIQPILRFDAHLLTRAMGGAIGDDAMRTMRAFHDILFEDFGVFGAWDDILRERRCDVARAFESEIHLRAAQSSDIEFDASPAQFKNLLEALGVASAQAALRRSVPATSAASGAPAPRL